MLADNPRSTGYEAFGRLTFALDILASSAELGEKNERLVAAG